MLHWLHFVQCDTRATSAPIVALDTTSVNTAATETTRARNRACAARLQACGLPRRTSWSLRRAVTVPLHDGVSHSSILAGPDGALAVNDLMRLAAVVQPLRILKPHSTRSSAPLEAKSVAAAFQFGAKLGVDQCAAPRSRGVA